MYKEVKEGNPMSYNSLSIQNIKPTQEVLSVITKVTHET